MSHSFDSNNKSLKVLTMVDGIKLKPTTLTIASTLVALFVNTIFVLLNSLESICKFWIWQLSPRENIHSKQVAPFHCMALSVDTTINGSRLIRELFTRKIVGSIQNDRLRKQPNEEQIYHQSANYK